MRLFHLLSLFGFASAAVKSCGGLFTIDQLGLTPTTTAKAGDNVSLSLLYTSTVEVTTGSVTNSVTYNFIPLTPTVTDLCASTTCPITIGGHDGSSWSTMPSGLSGTISTRIVWKDGVGAQLLCIDMSLKAS